MLVDMIDRRMHTQTLFMLCGLMLALACFAVMAQVRAAGDAAEAQGPASPLADSAPFQEDWDAIKQSGRLRIIVPANLGGGRYLPRRGSPVSQQQEVAEAFARFHGLEPELIIAESFADMIPAMLAGKGDLIVANLTVTDARRKQIGFSVPLAHVREKVLVRRDDDSITQVADLNGKTVMVSPSSTFWDSLNWLKQNKYKDIRLLTRPKGLVDEDELDLLARGEIDATIRDSNIVDMYAAYRDDFKVAVNFSSQRDIAWGVRKNAPQLLNALNQYLQLEHSIKDVNEVHFDDFDGIKKRKVLRVLLRNNASSYFLYKGELMGFEYEMARNFAAHHGLRLEVVVPPSHMEMLQWLKQGRADLAIGFLQPTARRKAMGVEFSEPYHEAHQHVVVREEDTLDNLDELAGRTISVRLTSAYWDSLVELIRQGHTLDLQPADEDLETEQLIRMVARGELDVTLADGQILDIELAKSTGVRSAFTVGDKQPHAVALRRNNPLLKKALNAFIKQSVRGELYNVLYSKYFTSRKSIRKLAKGRVDSADARQLSPWDPITRKYAGQYGFDWRLITAQMYQESRFDPNAKSFAGAQGLMQLMPRTAKSIGIKNLKDPESNIKGGIKYMDWLRDRFDDGLPVSTRLWLTLASYNAGHGHVRDAQRLAEQKGWDSSRWFDHTEKAMLLLARKEYANKARFGYVDGEEPVRYVREIRDRFEAYVKLKDDNIVTPPTQESAVLARLSAAAGSASLSLDADDE
jgi:membrane-bound lytic murein transglycosylase F